VVALDAAHQSNWTLLVAAISGQVGLIVLFVIAWSVLLVRRMTTKRTTRPSQLGMGAILQHRLLSSNPLAVVAGREVVSWLRDPMRMHYFIFALFYALLFCLLPLATGVIIFLPFAGVILIVMASMITNFYGTDGSSLWLTLVTPGAERADVRGRQLAWIFFVAPIAVILTVLGTAFSGQSWAWPWVLALTPALLGGAAGLLLLTSVFYLVPRTEPHLRTKETLQASGDMGQAILMLVLVPLTAIPAGACLMLGVSQNAPLLQWSGVVVGIVTGMFCFWFFGYLAFKRLEARGPELLHLMRSGTRSQSSSRGLAHIFAELTPVRRQIVLICLTLCWIPLVPQGIVPIIMKLNGNAGPSWFLALHLSEPYQWPTMMIMILIGIILLGIGLLAISQNKQAHSAKA
jgi:ABC-2 type transport system permease protein